MTSPSTKRRPRASWLLLGLALVVFLFAPDISAVAQDADELAKKANTELRTAQRNMFSRKFEEAQKGLEMAKDLIAKLRAAAPEHSRLKRLESTLARHTRDLARRTKQPTPTRPGAKAGTAKKLPGGVTNRLKKIDRDAKRIEALFAKDRPDDWKLKQLAYSIDGMKSIMAEIEKKYAAQIPAADAEVKARKDRIAAIDKKLVAYRAEVASRRATAAGDKAAREKLSGEWLARIKPFVVPASRKDHDKKKYLIPAGTADLKELQRRKKIFDEASVVLKSYRKAAFPAGKTDELLRVEKEFTYALESFAKGYKETLAGFFNEADKKLDQAATWLKREESKEDGKRKPLTLQRDLIPNIRKMVTLASGAVAKTDPKVSALAKKLGDVQKRNDKLLGLRKARTFLQPDRYKGKDLAELKTNAAASLHKKYADAKVLRTTVISPDWKEERVLEHTDTTKTAVRYRVTRSLRAQIAGKRGVEVVLFTIHIAKDRRTDGSWGPLHGHVMFEDPMLEKNVTKDVVAAAIRGD